MIKSLATTLSIAGLTALGPLTTEADATVSGTGSCTFHMPSKVTIASDIEDVPIAFGSDCAAAKVKEATWRATSVYRPQSYFEGAYTGRSSDFISFHADYDYIRRWQWNPVGATDAAGNSVVQYGPSFTDLRLGSYGRVTATRSGAKVSVRTAASRYWIDGSRFIGWAGARGQIQWRTPGTTAWRGLKDVYSSSTGTYGYTYTTTQTREYRVVLYDNTVKTIWGSISPTVRR
ncbi:MAG: hypothetical protein ACRCYR_09595 [Phycicoccus sp.]